MASVLWARKAFSNTPGKPWKNKPNWSLLQVLANISRSTLGASGCASLWPCHDIVAQELRVFSVKTVAFKTWRITIREDLHESKRQTDMDLKLDNKSQSFLKDLGTAERVVKSDWSRTFFCHPSDVWSWCCVFWEHLHSYWDEHRSVPWKWSNKSYCECNRRTIEISSVQRNGRCMSQGSALIFGAGYGHWLRVEASQNWLKLRSGFERPSQFALLTLCFFFGLIKKSIVTCNLARIVLGPGSWRASSWGLKLKYVTQELDKESQEKSGVNTNHE